MKPRIQRITVADGVRFYICGSFDHVEHAEGEGYIYVGIGTTPSAAYEKWAYNWGGNTISYCKTYNN